MKILKKEPALLWGFVGSVLTIVVQALSHQITWASAVPLIVGAITRGFVFAPASVNNATTTPTGTTAESGHIGD